MAGSSFWSRLRRFGTMRSDSRRLAKRLQFRPTVERLDERTLLSRFGHGADVQFRVELYREDVMFLLPSAQTATGSNNTLAAVGSTSVAIDSALAALISNAVFLNDSTPLKFAIPPDTGVSRISGTLGDGAYPADGGADPPANIVSRIDGTAGNSTNHTNGSKGDRLLTYLPGDDIQPGGPVHFISPAQPMVPLLPELVADDGGAGGSPDQDLIDRGLDLLNHALFEQGSMVVSMLRPDDSDHTDHGNEGDSARAFDAFSDDAPRPDGNGVEVQANDRNENSIINRPLPSISREPLLDDLAEEEVPAGKAPDLLVAYDPDLSSPQTELLPLKDGGSALVAALVAGAGKDSETVPPGPASLPEVGVAIGLDSGPALTASRSDAPEAARTSAAEESTAAGVDRACETILSEPAFDALLPVRIKVERPVCRWFEALLAAGVLVLNRPLHAGAASKRSREPDRESRGTLLGGR